GGVVQMVDATREVVGRGGGGAELGSLRENGACRQACSLVCVVVGDARDRSAIGTAHLHVRVAEVLARAAAHAGTSELPTGRPCILTRGDGRATSLGDLLDL